MKGILNVLAFTSEHDLDILHNPRSVSTVCTPKQFSTAVCLHEAAGFYLAYRSMDMTQDLGPADRAQALMNSALEREITSQLKQFPLQRSNILALVRVTGVPHDELFPFLKGMAFDNKIVRLAEDLWGMPD